MIDITGEIFGDLKVIERDYNYGKERNLKDWNKKTFWKCICLKCGEEQVRQGSELRKKKENNKCKYCGKSKIQIGEKYGLLTIISKNNNYKNEKDLKNRRAYFNCLCDCGNIVVKSSDHLRKNKNLNCGCLKEYKINEKKINDLSNKKFGLLTVIKINKEKSKPGQIFWDAICECGATITVCGKHLKNGYTISCGCYKSSIGEKQIEDILKENKIRYKKEYTVPELNNKRFDFAIFDDMNRLIRLIEYDGPQHFKPSNLFGEEEFNRLKLSDIEKNKWAKQNNIPLVRISFKYKNKINYEMLFENDNFLIK